MAKFQVGRLLLTKGAHELFMKDANFNKFVNRSLGRYVNGDWGVTPKEGCELNDEAVETGEDRILAAYSIKEHPDWNIWIVTEWDRSVTTVLFPDEY